MTNSVMTERVTWAAVVDALGGAGRWHAAFGREFLQGHIPPDSLRADLGWAVVDETMRTATIEPMMIRVSATPIAMPGTYIQTRIDGGDILHRTWRYGAMIEYLRSGATLVTNRADRLHPGPARLREEFEYFMNDPAWVNGYSCWTTNSAFGRHADGHATIIVQAEGAKHWRIWRGTGSDAELLADRVMEAGDIWHVPQGWDHQATGIGESLHWTFGVHVSTASDMVAMVTEAHKNRIARPVEEEDPTVLAAAIARDIPKARQIRSAESLERRGGLSLPWAVRGGPFEGTVLRWAARFPPVLTEGADVFAVESLGIRLNLARALEPWLREWEAGRSIDFDHDVHKLDLPSADLARAVEALVSSGLLLVERV